ncbi:MAG: hypothetical protein IJI61_02145 [Oscillospiraceae bacterium]|nr:hypothetical protein [Oscillospiraceae bacterium]
MQICTAIKEYRHRKKPGFVLAHFSLMSHPEFKEGSLSSGHYTGWSKPLIKIHEIEDLQTGQTVTFDERRVRIIEHSSNRIVLQFDKEGAKTPEKRKSEIKMIRPNLPVETGTDTGLYDASCTYYYGCWTSWSKWLHYYLGVRWDHWKDVYKARLIALPSYFTVTKMKRYWKFYRYRITLMLDGFFHRK